jgi:hypothetical protein
VVRPSIALRRLVVCPGQVRCHPEGPAAAHQVPGVVPLVRPHRPPVTAPTLPAEQLKRGLPFRIPRRRGERDLGDQAVAVLHEHMAPVGELGLLGVALPRQPRLWIGRRGMGGVAALLPPVVDVRVPAAASGTPRTLIVILRPEALERGPGLEQRAVDGEVMARHELAPLGLRDHRGEEPVGHLVLENSVAVLGEAGGVEGHLLDVHVEEPLEEQVVLEALAELALAPHRVEGDQQAALEQALRRDAVPPAFAYMASNVGDSSARMGSTIVLIRRIGWSAGMRSSGVVDVSIEICRNALPRMGASAAHDRRHEDSHTAVRFRYPSAGELFSTLLVS